MKAKITSFTFLLFFLSILIAQAQFPAPVNFDLQSPNIGIDNIFYLSWDPPTGNVGYYKIFRNNLLIDSCSTTTYKDTVEFYYICKYNLSAVYFDPPGESNPDSCCVVNIVLDVIKSPFVESFESNFYHTWGSMTEHGKGNWSLSIEDYYSGAQSVKFNFQDQGDSASFLSTHIVAVYTPVISIWYKTVVQNENFDNLYLKINDLELINLSHSDFWKQYQIKFQDSMQIVELFFYGISKGGGGIFIDDISIDEVSLLQSEGISSSDNWFEIYPNPFKDNLTVLINSSSETVLKFELINYLGQIIYIEWIRLTPGKNIYNFRTNSFPKGVHIARISNDEFSMNATVLKE